MDPTEALRQIGSVATYAELTSLVSRRSLRTAVERGTVVRLRGGSYALPHTDDAYTAAARLGGTVSHLSAALHWGWKVKLPPELPTVTVRRNRCKLSADGVELHWADLAAGQREGPATSKVQTVVDCARAYDLGVAPSVADSALRDGVDPELLLEAARHSPRTGRAKAVRVAELADARAANPFESVLRAIAATVPGLQVLPQQWVGDDERIGRVDLLDARLGLVIEAESFEFHSDRASLARDVRRYTALVCAGYLVVRFTWEDVMFHPDRVATALTSAVALRQRR